MNNELVNKADRISMELLFEKQDDELKIIEYCKKIHETLDKIKKCKTSNKINKENYSRELWRITTNIGDILYKYESQSIKLKQYNQDVYKLDNYNGTKLNISKSKIKRMKFNFAVTFSESRQYFAGRRKRYPYTSRSNSNSKRYHYCKICNLTFDHTKWNSHLADKLHEIRCKRWILSFIYFSKFVSYFPLYIMYDDEIKCCEFV